MMATIKRLQEPVKPMRVYASFDPFPAPKGAATHIAAFVGALARAYGAFELVTVTPSDDTRASPPALPSCVQHRPLPVPGRTLIDRVMSFREGMLRWWRGRRAELVHVRSIFEGYPLARAKGQLCERFVYEVNSFPSIELKYHYPDVADDRELMAKLEAQEQLCLEAADLVLTPSAVTGALIRARGVDEGRLRVIPNGVDPALFGYEKPRARGAGPMRLLYSGTLSAWQGIDVAIQALALLRRDHEAELTIVGPGRKRQRRRIAERAASLGVSDYVTRLPGCSQVELCAHHHAADAVLAPLLANDRNLVQGCSPLKVIEAMATGTPVVASDLPVVRELATDGVDALLVRPGSAKALKDGLLRLIESPPLAAQLSAAARARVERELSWSLAGERLIAAYEEVLGGLDMSP
jgi:glycosyltransferase involved in cell wall biosynthesis